MIAVFFFWFFFGFLLFPSRLIINVQNSRLAFKIVSKAVWNDCCVRRQLVLKEILNIYQFDQAY